jgi:hypothetical protein
MPEKTLMVFAAQPATDAAGHSVPVSLKTEGNIVAMTVEAPSETTYPIHVPLTVVGTTDKVSKELGLSDQNTAELQPLGTPAKPYVDPNFT